MILGGLFGLQYGFATGEATPRSKADAAATIRYLSARHAYVSTLAKDMPAVLAARREYASHIGQTCRGALRGAPQNAQTKEFSREILDIQSLIARREAKPATVQFEREVSHLRWSDSRIARAISSLLEARGRISRMQLPDLCVDARYWASTQFKTLAQGTQRFNARFVNLAFRVAVGHGTLEAAINRLLARYEKGRQRTQLSRPPERASGTPSWVTIIDSLEMNE